MRSKDKKTDRKAVGMKFRSRNGLTATIQGVTGGVMLSLYDSKGHLVRRRRKKAHNDAVNEIWSVDKGWRVA